MIYFKHTDCRLSGHKKELKRVFPAGALAALLLLPSLGYAGTPFFVSANIASAASEVNVNEPLQIFTTNGQDLVDGMEIDVTLPSGAAVSGSLRLDSGADQPRDLMSEIQGEKTVVVPFDGGSGALEIYLQDDFVTGYLLFDSSSNQYFSSAVDASGSGQLVEESADTLSCVSMPIDSSAVVVPTEVQSADVPDVEGIFSLQSRPGASRVIYVDYDGGTISGTAWNDGFNGGNPIVYQPYDQDGDPSTFGDTDRYLMYMGWLEMAEDYAPFDVNITTDETVFNDTARVFRSRINATPTRDWYGNAGGVAYLGVFGRNSDYYATGWTFNSTLGSMGMTHSHEAGHQMGLSHDGFFGLEYYRGHGRWGAIMGAPFNQEYVQWSKGDYPGATRTENDLTIISNRLLTLADDVGGTEATATTLSPPVFDVVGQITPDGLFQDVDMYTFTLAGDDPEASVEVATRPGAENESTASNAALNASLVDSSGLVIASMTSGDFSILSPFTNKLTYNGPLAAGTYFITVDAVSPNLDPGTGFVEYGNGGLYQVTVDTEADLGGPPVIEFPLPGSQLTSVDEIFGWSYSEMANTDFWLYLGSDVGKNDILNSGNIGSTDSWETAASNIELPLDGRNIYARLWYREQGVVPGTGVPWEFIDAEYTSLRIEGSIVITSPSATGELPGPTVEFEFADQTGSTDQWWIYAGSNQGTRDYFNSGLVDANEPDNEGAAVLGSLTVTGLPVDGSTVFVRLWNREIGNAWESTDFTFTASSASFVSFLSPASGSLLPGATTTFQFADSSNTVSEWWLYLGTAPGRAEYFNTGNLGSEASATSTDLPTAGETIYARLWYRIPGQSRWAFIDDVFTAAGADS